jgi:hypothetical protein
LLTRTKPFIGYFLVVGTEAASPKKPNTQKLACGTKIDPVFKEVNSYWDRYCVFCKRVVEEGLYTSATLLEGSEKHPLSKDYNLEEFLRGLVAHVAAETQLLLP